MGEKTRLAKCHGLAGARHTAGSRPLGQAPRCQACPPSSVCGSKLVSKMGFCLQGQDREERSGWEGADRERSRERGEEGEGRSP